MGRKVALKGLGVLALLVASLLLGGCGSVEPEKSQKASADWSRGLRVGVASLNQAVALQVAGEGEEVHLAWSEAGERGMEVAYLRLGQGAREEVRVRLSPGLFFPRELALVLDGADVVHLFCLGSGARNRHDGVYYSSLLANPPFLGLVPAWAAPALTWGLPLAIVGAAAGAIAPMPAGAHAPAPSGGSPGLQAWTSS